ncbi:hypothetical protein [Microbacterium sp. 2FI]|uniref:hypothetical protein n=1 Tax=Microbacterium sp. 2FI TaxID=2502193 RepID=UPI0010F85FCE|nr:hypothetical protein [Microbacterium sp. 2FI]
MSDLEIRGGGAIAVDTETLRQAAARFALARGELDAIMRRLGHLQLTLFIERDEAWDAASAASVLATRLGEVCAGADRIAAALRDTAAVYELVELNAAHHAGVLAGDRAEVARIDALRDSLIAAHRDAIVPARLADVERAVMLPGELVRQSTELGWAIGSERSVPAGAGIGVALGLTALAYGAGANVVGRGRLGRDARLSPGGAAVHVMPVAPVRATTGAPASLAAAAARIPGAGAARVRVETYTMRDGSRQHAVYVAGTQTLTPGGKDAWDAASNVELYTGQASASYEATKMALQAAGVEPGDVVHAFGHSQGAMITAHLALEGDYDTRTHVTFGSPVEADVGPQTLSVGLRHTDDPLAALAGGGHVGSVGAPGSFIAERSYDPASGIHDTALSSHYMSTYAETAALVDTSGDPRVTRLHDALAALGEAASVEVFEYGAERAEARVSPSSGGAG